MFVSIYYKPSLFNAHTVILFVHIFMNVNKLCLNQRHRQETNGSVENERRTAHKKERKKACRADSNLTNGGVKADNILTNGQKSL